MWISLKSLTIHQAILIKQCVYVATTTRGAEEDNQLTRDAQVERIIQGDAKILIPGAD